MKKVQMKKVLLITLTFLFSASPAFAAEYSYWGYWHGSTSGWAMSMEGATFQPADGSVEGWRYVKTAGDEIAPEPRVAPDFSSICASTPAQADSKRVAVVIDYGTVEGSGGQDKSTKTACTQLPVDADGFAVLQAASLMVSEKGMVTCVDGVPSPSCPVEKVVTTSAADTSNTSRYLIVAFVLLVAAAFFARRKSRA